MNTELRLDGSLTTARRRTLALVDAVTVGILAVPLAGAAHGGSASVGALKDGTARNGDSGNAPDVNALIVKPTDTNLRAYGAHHGIQDVDSYGAKPGIVSGSN